MTNPAAHTYDGKDHSGSFFAASLQEIEREPRAKVSCHATHEATCSAKDAAYESFDDLTCIFIAKGDFRC